MFVPSMQNGTSRVRQSGDDDKSAPAVEHAEGVLSTLGDKPNWQTTTASYNSCKKKNTADLIA